MHTPKWINTLNINEPYIHISACRTMELCKHIICKMGKKRSVVIHHKKHRKCWNGKCDNLRQSNQVYWMKWDNCVVGHRYDFIIWLSKIRSKRNRISVAKQKMVQHIFAERTWTPGKKVIKFMVFDTSNSF